MFDHIYPGILFVSESSPDLWFKTVEITKKHRKLVMLCGFEVLTFWRFRVSAFSCSTCQLNPYVSHPRSGLSILVCHGTTTMVEGTPPTTGATKPHVPPGTGLVKSESATPPDALI